MRKKLIIILPIIAFSILLTHALFGHLIFGFSTSTGQDINKHSTYIHLGQDWNSYPKNILFDVTTVWSNPNPNINDPYYEDVIGFHLKSEYNPNELQYLNDKSYVELNHEFSDCQNTWKPIAYRHTTDTLSHFFDNFMGVQINSDPYVVEYFPLSNEAYGLSEQKTRLESGYSHFIPICTSKEITSYDYSIKINDDQIGFDVYFVPSIAERDNFHQNSNEFSFHLENGCFAHNYQRFSGTCENVEKNSGLLIIIPDELSLSITEITIYLHERF